MSTLTLAPPASRAELSSLRVPPRLPENHRGEPLRHLSYSGITKFRGCPDDFRRSYILGAWGLKNGDMFLGSRVDDAISGYCRAQMAGTTLDLEAVKDLYNELWKRELAYEAARNGPVRFGTKRNMEQTHRLGIKAVEMAMEHLVPHLGRPISVQRSFDFKLDERLEWSITGKVDLETIRDQTVYLMQDGSEHPEIRDHGYPEPVIALAYQDAPTAWRPIVKRGRDTLEPREAIALHEREAGEYDEQVARWRERGEDGDAPKPPKALPDVKVPVSQLTVEAVRRQVAGIVDFKVTGRPRYDSNAGDDMQASIYLGDRWLAGDPAFDFRFAQILKPGSNGRVNMGHSMVPTRRSTGELRAAFMRIAQTARQIWGAYRRFGPNQPWGWATEDWRCRNCDHGPAGTAECPFAMRASR